MNALIQKRRNLKNRKGFTLIELIVVIVIVGILAAILIPQFGGFTDKAKTTQVVVDAKQIATAAEAHSVEHGTAPTAAEIVAIAGTDIVTANIGSITLETNGHVTFTYFIEDDKFYAAVRDDDGEFYTGVGATSAAALTAAAAALPAATP